MFVSWYTARQSRIAVLSPHPSDVSFNLLILRQYSDNSLRRKFYQRSSFRASFSTAAPKPNTPWSIVQPSSISAPSSEALAPQLHESVTFPAQKTARAEMLPRASTMREDAGLRPWSNAPNICGDKRGINLRMACAVQ